MTNTKPSPIEVWLTQKNMTVTCMEVHDDETTHSIDVDSLSLRGAQREITGHYISQGYTPIGRWENTDDTPDPIAALRAAGAGARETVRRFKLA